MTTVNKSCYLVKVYKVTKDGYFREESTHEFAARNLPTVRCYAEEYAKKRLSESDTTRVEILQLLEVHEKEEKQ